VLHDCCHLHHYIFLFSAGELSVLVEELAILTKSLLPLPDKWHGLTDIEKRYRQRYVDMIMNPDVAEVFRSRARITSEIRRHMDNLGFLEIETPVLQVDHPLQVFCILLHACVWRIL
jgi:lysyl-tRNA synthetase class II